MFNVYTPSSNNGLGVAGKQRKKKKGKKVGPEGTFTNDNLPSVIIHTVI